MNDGQVYSSALGVIWGNMLGALMYENYQPHAWWAINLACGLIILMWFHNRSKSS